MTYTKEQIVKGLGEYDPEAVNIFADYCIKLLGEKKKNESGAWVVKNEFIQKYEAIKLIGMFKKVAKDGLYIDGDTITITKTGISYNYKAYKNRLLLKYPESIIDHQLVYKEDMFNFSKTNGKISYKHEFGDPFNQTDANIIGGYCIIKNHRGEFITTLGIKDIEKCRKVAKTDSIWKQWYKQMCLKTVIKSACSLHFNDEFKNMESIDNESNDIDNPMDIKIDDKSQVDELKSLAELREFYTKNKDKFTKNPALLKYITKKSEDFKKAEAQKGVEKE